MARRLQWQALITAMALYGGLLGCSGGTAAVAPPSTTTPRVAVELPAPPRPAPTTPRPAPAPVKPTVTPQTIVVNTIPENGRTLVDALPFQTEAFDPAVGNQSGAGIATVTFQFFGPDGHEVYSHVEQNSLYCAFGGGDGDQPCTSWAFSEHNNQWPNGKPAVAGPHRLLVTIHTSHGGVVRQQRTMNLELN